MAVLLLLQAQKRFGVQIQVIPETDEGDIDIAALKQMLAQQVSRTCGMPGRRGVATAQQAIDNSRDELQLHANSSCCKLFGSCLLGGG